MDQLPWAVYTRISYARKPDGTVDTLGVERQEPPCRELVGRKGGEVARVFIDNDRSAFKGRRPDFEEMLSWARAGRVRGIAVWDCDRLSRNPTVTTSASSSWPRSTGSSWRPSAASTTCPPPRGG